MDIKEAVAIIKDLSDGFDPNTRQPLSHDSIYQRPSVVRALCKAVEVMERRDRIRERKQHLPGNAGKPWTRSEDEELCRKFDRGERVFSIAMQHSRTVGSIAARLVRLNKLSADELPRMVGPEKASRITDYEVARRSAAHATVDDDQMTTKVS